MVVFGIDPHKASHTVVVVDGNGRQLGMCQVPATAAGHARLLAWAAPFVGDGPGEAVWAVEDCRHVAGPLLLDLWAAGLAAVLVPPRMTAVLRGAGRAGKSDPIDALAVARAAQANPDLPVFRPAARELDLRALTDYREHLVALRTKEINRIRWDLTRLDPQLEAGLKNLTSRTQLARATAAVTAMPATVATRIVLAALAQVAAWTAQIVALEREITAQVTPIAPNLLAIVGIGPLTAAKIIGEVAGIDRFASAAKLARYAGTAPIPVNSGKTEGRHRLHRGGDRQLNAAVHRAALTQARMHEPAKALIARRRTARDTKKGAMRVLKRHLINAIYTAMTRDQQALPNTPQPTTTPALPAAA